MERQIVHEIIFSKHFDGDHHPITFGDLPKNLEDTDIIEIDRDEGYYSENNSWDAFTQLRVERPRLENDEEFAESQERWKEKMTELKANRYQSYLRLKKEFGDGD